MFTRAVRAPSRLVASASSASLLSLTESLPLVHHPSNNWRRDFFDDLWRRLEIVTVCVAYGIFGPAVIVVNNHIVKDLTFPYPMILSAIGLFSTSCFCTAFIHAVPDIATRADALPVPVRLDRSGMMSPDVPLTNVGEDSPPTASKTRSPVPDRWRPSWTFWFYNMAPIGVMQGVTFACGNAAYMHLTITLTQMLSAFTPTVRIRAVALAAQGGRMPQRDCGRGKKKSEWRRAMENKSGRAATRSISARASSDASCPRPVGCRQIWRAAGPGV
jgi:hypothetical protein